MEASGIVLDSVIQQSLFDAVDRDRLQRLQSVMDTAKRWGNSVVELAEIEREMCYKGCRFVRAVECLVLYS